MNLSGKVALVTGGGRDIGRSVSLRLAKAGATVIVNFANNADAANDTVKAITDAGGTARAHRADVTDMAAVQAMVDAVKAFTPSSPSATGTTSIFSFSSIAFAIS